MASARGACRTARSVIQHHWLYPPVLRIPVMIVCIEIAWACVTANLSVTHTTTICLLGCLSASYVYLVDLHKSNKNTVVGKIMLDLKKH